MSSRELDSKNRNTVRTYFPNGIVYSSAVYEDNKIVKCSKYFTNGNLAQKIQYQGGLITIKESFNRGGEKAETTFFYYNDVSDITKIVREKINKTITAIFEYDESSGKINYIYIKQNNIIIRRLEFEYGAKSIICNDATNDGKVTYFIMQAPIASEYWLDIASVSSLVMRKLKSAFSLSA